MQRSLVIEAAKDIQTTLQCPMYVQLTKETFMRILERYICRVQCRQLDTSLAFSSYAYFRLSRDPMLWSHQNWILCLSHPERYMSMDAAVSMKCIWAPPITKFQLYGTLTVVIHSKNSIWFLSTNCHIWFLLTHTPTSIKTYKVKWWEHSPNEHLLA